MSISRKFIVWTVSIIFAFALLTAYLYYRLEMQEEKERTESLAGTVAPLIEESLASYMLSRDINVLERTLSRIKNIKPIGTLWIINREGIVKGSTVGEEVGKKLSVDGPGCRDCHHEGRRGILLEGQKIFRWVHPVRNAPQCHKCHDPLVKYNGVIITDFSLAESQKHLKKDILRGLLIFVPSLLTVGFVLLFLSKKVVIERLNRVGAVIKRFREGDYNARIPMEGRDEITELEESFNEMAGALRDAFEKVSCSQKEWQETFDSITDLITILDRDYRIIRANRAVAEYFGLSMKDVINKQCHEIFHEMHLPLKGCPFKLAFDNSQSLSCEVSDEKNNKIFQVSVFPFYSAGGEIQGMVHLARDVTEEKEREMRLIMSERLATLGQMASGIAHEINNPLAAIAGCTEGLLKRVEQERFEPEVFRNYLKIIEEEILRCKNITSGMLSFVRTSTYDKQDVDIHKILDKTIEMIGFQGRLKEVELIKDYTRRTAPYTGERRGAPTGVSGGNYKCT